MAQVAAVLSEQIRAKIEQLQAIPTGNLSSEQSDHLVSFRKSLLELLSRLENKGVNLVLAKKDFDNLQNSIDTIFKAYL